LYGLEKERRAAAKDVPPSLQLVHKSPNPP
jgi:hypothetical protein